MRVEQVEQIEHTQRPSGMRDIAAGAPWGHRQRNVGGVTVAERGLDTLRRIRMRVGERRTLGLSDMTIASFLTTDPMVSLAIARAWRTLERLNEDETSLIRNDEETLCNALSEDYISFYGTEASSPYVPLGAAGPWIITAHGSVLHDSGGYGMLGLGHAPPVVMATMNEPWVMANVMTPSFSQRRFSERLKREIGHRREGETCPFERFICLNSGSEAVSLAGRISDIQAARQTSPGGRHEGKRIRLLSLSESFHGRTERPARLSHSTKPTYEAHLASFRDDDRLEVVEPNDLEGLRAAFARAEDEGVYFESFFLEPVMGEGQPGLSLTREFYDEARRLTREQGSLLVVDSIQAALRAHGCLSIVDYPGFEDCDPPDMETYSKALNAGQFPLSVVALSREAAELYVIGVYGNTMTTNPRALEVGCAVLDAITKDLRENIRERGTELKTKLECLAASHSGSIVSVSGTGLMVCVELEPTRHSVVGRGGVEDLLRRQGIVMIHGGHNGLRFTPHFSITSGEIDLIVKAVGRALQRDKRKAA